MPTFDGRLHLVSAWRVNRVKRQKRTENEINSRARFSTQLGLSCGEIAKLTGLTKAYSVMQFLVPEQQEEHGI